MWHGHILRSLYIDLICSATEKNFNPVEFGWNSVDSVLMTNKCIGTVPWCTLLVVAARKNALEDVSATILALYAQNFASAWRRI